MMASFRFALASAICVLTFFGAAAAQDVQPAGANPFQALDDCVTREALRLEVSREAADIVAEAAVEKCGRELNAATPDGGVMRSNAAARAQLKESMRETALVAVVETRAARYTPAPPPPKPAPKPKPKKKITP